MDSGYFAEHGVRLDDRGREVREDEEDTVEEGSDASRMLLGLARRLAESGFFLEEEASSLFDDLVPPPTAKKFVEDLEQVTVRDEEPDFQCPICLKQFEQDDVYVGLPCRHKFHQDCVMPWLKKTSSCPLCRHSLPTDDPVYEEMKRQRRRRKQREHDIEQLHNSMFG